MDTDECMNCFVFIVISMEKLIIHNFKKNPTMLHFKIENKGNIDVSYDL